MKIFQKYFLPLIAGFIVSAAATSLSLMLFVNRFMLVPDEMEDIFANDGFSITFMMTLSAFLIYAAMLFCRKLNGRWLGDSMEERSGRYLALYLTGSALAAVCAILLAMANEGNFAATLVTICYSIVSDLIVIIAFVMVVLFVKWLMKLAGKDGAFLYKLRWQLPLSLLWIAAVFTGFLYF